MTTMNQQANVLGISNAKIAAVTTNSASNYAITSPKDLPQLKQLTTTVKSVEKEAIAGFTLVDSFTIKQSYDVKFESVKIPLDVIALINGSTLTTNGTDPNQYTTVVDSSSDVPVLFNLAFNTNFVNNQIAQFGMELYCVKGLLDVQVKTDDYWLCSFTGKAMARVKDGHFRQLTALQTQDTINGGLYDTLEGGTGY